MQLPRLKVLQGQQLTRSDCKGLEQCKTCVLYRENGGRCDGCTPKHKDEMTSNFKSCYRECHECAGFKVDVTAVCCRSPLLNTYMTAVTKGADDWNKPQYTYTERPRLSYKQRAVFYISSGGINTIAPKDTPLFQDEHDIIAVNLTRVWGGNGFYSKDLKDYLHLPSRTKLALMTMTLDDLLERGFERELYADPHEFTRVGIDHWMPLSFSAYPNEPHMHQYYQLLRTLYCTEKSQAWWVTGDHIMPGLAVDDLLKEALKKVPQVIFNMQFVNDENALRWHMHSVKKHHELAPANVSFWFVGAATPTFVKNMRNVSGTRDLYFISAKPLYLASKGQEFKLGGGSAKSLQTKHQLLQENFQTFTKLVKQYG